MAQRLFPPCDAKLIKSAGAVDGRCDIPAMLDAKVDHQAVACTRCDDDFFDKINIAGTLKSKMGIACLAKTDFRAAQPCCGMTGSFAQSA